MNTNTPPPAPVAPLDGLCMYALVKSKRTGRRARVVHLSDTHARLEFSEYAPTWRVDLTTLAKCYFIV